jgi:beta-glucanase (GH16 family)
MPDRGVAAGPQWKRQDTNKGGMEFDVMEHLTRWGPHRFNVAMHWDGYEKSHKALGSSAIYVQADKDGFITCGLLWTPGAAVYYCNGKEILRWEDPRISNVESDMMFTLPMGGWDNNALDDSKLPADFVVDYVRVWQRKDLASEVDGPKHAPPTTAPAK